MLGAHNGMQRASRENDMCEAYRGTMQAVGLQPMVSRSPNPHEGNQPEGTENQEDGGARFGNGGVLNRE